MREKRKGPTHFQYEGRNVLVGSRRADKIEIWERKEATKKARRVARRTAQ